MNTFQNMMNMTLILSGSICGNKVAHVGVYIGFGTFYDEMLFDLETGDVLNISYEQFEKQNGL